MSTEAEAARTAFLDAGSRGKDGKSEQAFIVPWGCDVICTLRLIAEVATASVINSV